MILIDFSKLQELINSFTSKFHQVFFVFWLRFSGFRMKSAFIITQIIICFIFAVIFPPSKVEACSFKPSEISSISDHGGFMVFNESFENVINFRAVRFTRNIINAVFSDKAQCYCEGVAKFFGGFFSQLLTNSYDGQKMSNKDIDENEKNSSPRKLTNSKNRLLFYITNYPIHSGIIFGSIIFLFLDIFLGNDDDETVLRNKHT